jgi:hypothetical protein
MHTTDTVDYDTIISGELCLELDDGKEVRLKPGDIVIQNGDAARLAQQRDEALRDVLGARGYTAPVIPTLYPHTACDNRSSQWPKNH